MGDCSVTVKMDDFSVRVKMEGSIHFVIEIGFFSEAFLFKPRGGHSPPSSLNRKPRKNPLFSL